MSNGRTRSSTWLARTAAGAVVPLAALSMAACTSSTPSASAAADNGSCAGVAGPNHARVVVETSAGHVLSRCVGFTTPTISAVKLLQKSRFEMGTQQYSFGLAICQLDNVPAHYTQCLPSGADYWALFTSNGGKAWTSPSVGVSDVTLEPGDSIGLRYDSPQGNPAPPPPPTRA